MTAARAGAAPVGYRADYVIVGGGSAGCVLANRLSADPTRSVLLIEAGDRGERIDVDLPLACARLWNDPTITWMLESAAEPGLDGRRIAVPRGRALGGSSAINGMICQRGHPSDYDGWRDLGLTGWGFEDVLPYFRRLESHWRGASSYHGADGPVGISASARGHPLQRAVLDAAAGLGFPITDDFNGPQPEGFGLLDFTISRGRRASTARAYLAPAERRANLTVITEAQVTGVRIEDGRAVGVTLTRGGEALVAAANAEVILCAGAFHSAQLLLLSGVGGGAQLQRQGLSVLVDRPAVGANLHDHPGTAIVAGLPSSAGFDQELRADRFIPSLAEWWLKGQGPFRTPALLASAFVRVSPDAPSPDTHFMATNISMDARVWFPGLRAPAGDVLTISVMGTHPKSRGAVTLVDPDPRTPPLIQFNLLADEADRAVLRRALRTAFDMFDHSALASYRGDMIAPTHRLISDDELDAYLRETVGTAFHPVGTCRMGVDDESVLDGSLRVRGVESLRVVDASAMPAIVGGNTNVPVIMMAEKAADVILGRSAPPAEAVALEAPATLEIA